MVLGAAGLAAVVVGATAVIHFIPYRLALVVLFAASGAVTLARIALA